MIHLLVALPAEARPLLDFYRLREKTTVGSFRIYRGTGMALVVSGPGKVAAAAASALLAARLPPAGSAAWLNIGIAGHATYPVGQSLIAHRITDRASGRSWYPPQLFDLATDTASLLSVDAPEDDYPGDAACDMEASGFYPVACNFTSSELVQCFKVISDNRARPAAQITARGCTRLIEDKLGEIDPLVRALDALAREHSDWHAPHTDLERISGQWHFTVSQGHQLTELARRWQALMPGRPLWLDGLDKKRNAADVLRHLRTHLEITTATELKA